MAIQNDQAQRKGVLLSANYTGFKQDFETRDNYELICDEQRVMQVVLQLQSNALKFTQQGRVTINVSIDE